MLEDIMKDPPFQTIMALHIQKTLAYLLKDETPFGLLCRRDFATFDPPLPHTIADGFQEVTLFMIAGYTLESFRVDAQTVTFEAGFGPDNFGSVVTIPILATLQILVEETPILINLAQPSKPTHQGIQNSLESFLSNPENQKFLKR